MTTRGRRRASASKSLRTAQNVSSPTATPGPPSPSALSDQLADQVGLLFALQQLGDRTARRLGVGLPLDAHELANHLGERPVGDALAVRQAMAQHDGRIGLDLADELLDETRFPHAGRPEHRQQLTGPIPLDRLEGSPERHQLVLAADQRRVESPRVPRNARPHLDEPPGLDFGASLDDA